MIKLKNLWKIALATMAMSAMLVACDTESSNSNSEETSEAGIYLSGLNGKWADNTTATEGEYGPAYLMTKGENDVYTLTFKAEAAKPFPNGFKFSTENGWMEQFQAYDKANPTTDLTTIEIDKEFKVFEATKAMLEETDENDEALIKDDATKWQIPLMKACKKGNEYTVTFDKKNMTVKIEGEFVDVKPKTITLTIVGLNDDNEKAKLILKNVPTFDVDGVATIDGSLFGWGQGKAVELDASDCEVAPTWIGADAEENKWIAEQAPKETVEGADAWAKLIFSAGTGDGWVPYSTTGEFTYDWTKRK